MTEPKKSNERLTRQYLESALTANRQHCESLFSKASARVEAVVEKQIEARLKTALSIIRPEISRPLQSLQADRLSRLRMEMAKLASEYEIDSGLRVRYVVFDRQGSVIIVKPVVANV